MNWELIWLVIFFGLLLAFGTMAILVIINGARDIRKLLVYLEESDGKDGDQPRPD